MSKVNRIILFVFLGVALLSTVAYLGYLYVYRTPQRVVESMQKKMGKVKSLHYKSENSLTGNFEDTPVSLSVNIEGDSDKKDANNPKDHLKLEANGNFLLFSLNTDIEMTSSGKDLFFKVNEIPSIMDLYSKSKDFIGKWVRVELLSKDSSGELSNLIEDPNFFSKDIKVLGSEKINGTNTVHYSTSINKDCLSKFIDQNLKTDILTSQEVSDIKKNTQSLNNPAVEIWIGARNDFLYRMKGNLVYNESPREVLEFTINFSKFDELLKIETPSSYETVEKTFGTFLGDIQKLQTQNITG